MYLRRVGVQYFVRLGGMIRRCHQPRESVKQVACDSRETTPGRLESWQGRVSKGSSLGMEVRRRTERDTGARRARYSPVLFVQFVQKAQFPGLVPCRPGVASFIWVVSELLQRCGFGADSARPGNLFEAGTPDSR
jgi:hypothetical protein